MIEKKFYKCNVCGNFFGVIEDAGVVPECCGTPMEELKANTTDAAQEKHVPVIERDGNKVTVKVGSVPHPMQDDHYITWIMVTNKSGTTEREALKPGDQPEAVFYINEDEGPITAYEYCNLHGLWAAEEK
jgi:superoxide reductase